MLPRLMSARGFLSLSLSISISVSPSRWLKALNLNYRDLRLDLAWAHFSNSFFLSPLFSCFSFPPSFLVSLPLVFCCEKNNFKVLNWKGLHQQSCLFGSCLILSFKPLFPFLSSYVKFCFSRTWKFLCFSKQRSYKHQYINDNHKRGRGT